jgi:acylphosphatase
VTARARVRVTGFVQGVGFRYALQARARSLGVAGWVRNERDGSVAAVLEGPRDHVESVVRWCGRGPSGADVDAVETVWQEPEGLTGFSVQ